MNAPAMDLGECVAAALMTMRTAAKQDHPWETVFALIPQHSTARLGSLVDDAWLTALTSACPYCCAERGEECRFDCSSQWTDGAQ